MLGCPMARRERANPPCRFISARVLGKAECSGKKKFRVWTRALRRRCWKGRYATVGKKTVLRTRSRYESGVQSGNLFLNCQKQPLAPRSFKIIYLATFQLLSNMAGTKLTAMKLFFYASLRCLILPALLQLCKRARAPCRTLTAPSNASEML